MRFSAKSPTINSHRIITDLWHCVWRISPIVSVELLNVLWLPPAECVDDHDDSAADFNDWEGFVCIWKWN